MVTSGLYCQAPILQHQVQARCHCWPLFALTATMLQGAQQQLQEAGFEGCLLGGNYVAGVALGKCVEYAYEYAGKVASYLESSSAALATAVPPNTQQDDDVTDTFSVSQN